MATMNITVNANVASQLTFTVTSEQANSCRTLWTLTTTNANTIGNTLHVEASDVIGLYVLTCNDPNYLYNTNYVTTVKNIWTLEIENSGIPGVYRQATITITNITTGAVTALEFQRYNDSGNC